MIPAEDQWKSDLDNELVQLAIRSSQADSGVNRRVILEEVRSRLLSGGDVDAVNNQGASLLHIAAAGNDLEMVNLLIGHGADIEAEQPDGCRPLLAAAYWRNAEVAEVLYRAGANPEIQDDYGETAIAAAEKNGLNAFLDVVHQFRDEQSLLNESLLSGPEPGRQGDMGL